MKLVPVVAISCSLVLPAVALGAVRPGKYEGRAFVMTLGHRSLTIDQKDRSTTLSGRCTSTEADNTGPWHPTWDPAKLRGPVPVVGQELVYRATVDRSPPNEQKTIYKYKAVVRFTSRHRAQVTFTSQYTTTVASTSYRQVCKASRTDVVRGPK